MAASATLTFDTTAPVLTLGQPVWDPAMPGHLHVPYTITEEAVVSVGAASVPGFGPVNVVVNPVEPGVIRLSGVPENAASVLLVVRARDEVLNLSETEQLIAIDVVDVQMPLSLSIDPVVPRSLMIDTDIAYPLELTVDPAEKLLSIDASNNELTIEAVPEKSLTIEPVLAKQLAIDLTLIRQLAIDAVPTDRSLSIDDITYGLTIDEYHPSQEGEPPPEESDEVAAIAASVDDLPSNPVDGDLAIIRAGAYPNVHDEELTWDEVADKWIGREHVLVTQGDTWAMDLGNRNSAQRLDWSPVDNAVPFGKAHAVIDGPLDLNASAFTDGTGVITVDDTSSPHSYSFTDSSGAGFYLQIRDNYISHTGRTATQFTGCRVVEGSRGVIADAEWVTQGFPGGWGFTVNWIAFASDLWGAGLRLQERFSALMNSAPGEVKLSAAPYWHQYDPGDGSQPNAIPPSGGLGVSSVLTSLDNTGGAAGGERSFYVTENDWSEWALAAPTKRFLIPRIVGRMVGAAPSSGSILDAKLVIRWVV